MSPNSLSRVASYDYVRCFTTSRDDTPVAFGRPAEIMPTKAKMRCLIANLEAEVDSLRAAKAAADNLIQHIVRELEQEIRSESQKSPTDDQLAERERAHEQYGCTKTCRRHSKRELPIKTWSSKFSGPK